MYFGKGFKPNPEPTQKTRNFNGRDDRRNAGRNRRQFTNRGGNDRRNPGSQTTKPESVEKE